MSEIERERVREIESEREREVGEIERQYHVNANMQLQVFRIV